MLQFLLDTDHLTLFQHRHPALMRRIAARPAGLLGISPINVEETLRGRLAPLARLLSGTAQVQAYADLVDAVHLILQFPIVPFDSACDAEYQRLRSMRLRIGTHDLKIAAVALVNQLTLLTRNRRDFGRIPSLTLDDWSV
jgi:tRNA(fMet)-specific endonuclease VapC